MVSYVVLAAHSLCGPVTIKARTPNEAAMLYNENCHPETSTIWVWNAEDYQQEPRHRPDPREFDVSEFHQMPSA